MGLEIAVAKEVRTLSEILGMMVQSGQDIEIIMMDGALVAPESTLPVAWRDVRLRTPEGTITVTRRGAGLAVVVFGNADQKLIDVQKRIASLLSGN